MSKHTPGPWHVDACPDASGFSTVRLADGTENGNTGEQPIATVYGGPNARLIAAAPDLLAALQDAAAAFAVIANRCEEAGEEVGIGRGADLRLLTKTMGEFARKAFVSARTTIRKAEGA